MFRFFKLLITIFLCAFLISACESGSESVSTPNRLFLHQNWTFSGVDTLGEMPAKVPGTVHTDLMNAGIIPDPFRDNNALEMGWIETRDWEYHCQFELSESQLERDAIDLVLEGLDTYATVWLNGNEILRADNMFRLWRTDVKSLLTPGGNELEIRFDSSIKRHENHADSLGLVYPADNDPTKTAPFVRKAAYHFGWDWAPRLVTCGVWKPVYLEFRDVARIAEVRIEQKTLTDSLAILKVTAHIEHFSDKQLDITVMGQAAVVNGAGVSIQVEIHNPERWWPNSSGEPHLYSVPIKLWCDGVVIDSCEKKIGLRTVELVNEPDSIGTSFYFKVNGEPVFMQGANYVPQDVFLPRVKPNQYRQLLIAAKEAHMNMIRVWGGGVYERDLFYNLCDSLGLLVWQDFMFAGTMYPGDSAFVQNVSGEVRQQIKRLRHHPCLAIWCGNNEIDVAWHNWGWQQKCGYSAADSAKMWKDYLHVFQEVIPEIVEQESPEIAYVPTSPQSNWGTAENFNHGSMHYWGVWHGREPISAFEQNVGRFMVEYGMQSYPALETLREFISEDQLHLDSEVLIIRQKSYIGDEEIWRHIRDAGFSPQNMEEFIDASQAIQAEALRTAIHAHKNSNGHCMGTLFWQLNDCWPGPSWSVIDYRGRKKSGYKVVRNVLND